MPTYKQKERSLAAAAASLIKLGLTKGKKTKKKPKPGGMDYNAMEAERLRQKRRKKAIEDIFK